MYLIKYVNELLGVILLVRSTTTGIIIDKHKVNEPNPLFSLANRTRQHVTQQDNHPTQYTSEQHTNIFKRANSIIKYIQYI